MITLPTHFLFTQYSLSSFENCPLKFRKRYVENLKWDSLPDKDKRQGLEAGRDFHLLAYRYFSGIETGMDEASKEYGSLGLWLNNLKSSFKLEENVKYLPEYKIRMSAPPLILEANFDLLKVKEDSIEIWDWKTHGVQKENNRVFDGIKLKNSLQTIVYLYVLKEQAALISGRNIESDRISMHYWQPDPSGTLAEISYSEEMHAGFRTELECRIKEILEYDYSNFNKELYKKHCRYCEFNWLCNGGSIDFSSIEDVER